MSFSSEADHEVFEDVVEALDIALRVTTPMTCPLEGPIGMGIRSAFAKNVPLASLPENDHCG